MEARGAKRVKKMSTVHVGKWQFVIKGGGGVRWTSIGIVMYRAHARKRWRATLRGTYFSLKKKKVKSKLCALFGTREGKEPRSIIPIISHIYAQFFLRTISYVSLQRLSSVHSISQIKFFLDERRRLARDRAKVKIRGGFHRHVALEPSTCSRGTLRSHYLMVITGVERPIGREV